MKNPKVYKSIKLDQAKQQTYKVSDNEKDSMNKLVSKFVELLVDKHS